MIEMVQYNYIRYLYYNKGMSIRAIAKLCDVHRKTVNRALLSADQRYCLKSPKPKPVNGNYQDRIVYLVKENWERAKKDQCTKQRLYALIKEEGYTGSYEAFTWQVRQIEEEQNHTTKEAFVKLLPFRSHLQVDFGEIEVMDQGVPRKIFFFCAKLCWSKVEFVRVYPRSSSEFLFDGLVQAFSFFGGVPKVVLFDNLSPAVKRILPERERILQESFLRFQSFYCFESIFCAPGKGNEKGMVENLVRYIKNNYFRPKPVFHGFPSMNDWLLKQCENRRDTNKLNGKNWVELWLEEQPVFLPFRDHYEYVRCQEAKVDTYQLVHVESNRYSVPTSYVGKRVQVKLFPFQIQVISQHQLIATHDRLFGKDHETLNPYHYLSLLEKKARAYAEAKVIHDWHLPNIYETYHQRLQGYVRSKSKGTREFIAILRLTERYGVKEVGCILQFLASQNRYSYEDVMSHLRFQQEKREEIPGLSESILAVNSLSTYTWNKPTLAPYAQCLEKEEEG